MRIENALKLARKHGAVRRTKNAGGVRWHVHVAPNRKVTFRERSDGYIDNIHYRWADGNGVWSGWQDSSLYHALASAKRRYCPLRLRGRLVVIDESFSGRSFARKLRVELDRAEVVGESPELNALVDGALDTGCPAAVIDWIEENYVARRPHMIVI